MHRTDLALPIRHGRRSRLKLSHLLSCAAVAAGLWGTTAHATSYYWDTNTVGAGAGQTPTGTWDGTNMFFNTDATGGNGATSGTFVSTLTSADSVQFVAGPTLTATGDTAVSGGNAYTVSVTGTQTAGALIFDSVGAMTLGSAVGSGTISLGGQVTTLNATRYTTGTTQVGQVFINSNLALTADQTWTSSLVSAGNGAVAMTIAGAVTGTSNLTIAPTTNRAILVSGNMTETGNLTVNGGNGVVNISGNINNTGNLSLAYGNAASSLNLSRAAGNTYSGTTSITGGTLNISNTSGSATSAGNVTLNSAAGAGIAIISGSGFTTGLLTVTNGGTLLPGSVTGAGTLRLGTTGGLTLTSGVLNMNLSATAASGNDLINTSVLTLGSTLTVNLAAIGTAATVTNGLATGVGVTYTLIDANGTSPLDLSGTTITTNFATGGVGTTTAGFTGTYAATYSSNATGDLLVTFTPVPEPSTWAGASFLLVLFCWNQRKRLFRRHPLAMR